MKVLVETTGDFCLSDLLGGQVIEAYRPTVVTLTPFVSNLRGVRINVLEDLADDASDAELAAAATDEALEAAIAKLPRREKPAPKSKK